MAKRITPYFGAAPNATRAFVLIFAGFALVGAQTPTFKSKTNLQTIAVRVTDKQDRDLRGLRAYDFTLLEDGHPQQIAYFGSESQPVSLAVLLDSSSSMESSRKLGRARALLRPLLRGGTPDDEIFFSPFTDRVKTFERFTPEQRLNPPIPPGGSTRGGTALYDALATAICHLRTAQNLRQAIVVITDGSDQHSRLRLEQLVHLAQSTRAQVFMVGFFEQAEYDYYKQSGDTVTLVSGREIDNPVRVFARISKESGAEAFFPASEENLQSVLGRILGMLQAEYTLSYYPTNVDRFRTIRVKVNHKGAKVTTRRRVASEAESASESVKFSASSCEVSTQEHPYPWEPLTVTNPSGVVLYSENFSDPRTGWPNRDGSRYVRGAYEISHAPPRGPSGSGMGERVAGTIAAYGPWWSNFHASLLVDGDATAGMVFRLNDVGCYLLLLSRAGSASHLAFKLVRKTFSQDKDADIIPWTTISDNASSKQSKISADVSGSAIKIQVNGIQVASVTDDNFSDGLVGMAQYGIGHAFFRDLFVEGSR